MVVLWAGALTAALLVENAHPGVALQAAGAATEGKEIRFGIPLSAMFAVSTTADVDRCRRLHALLLHRARRRGAAAQHAAR